MQVKTGARGLKCKAGTHGRRLLEVLLPKAWLWAHLQQDSWLRRSTEAGTQHPAQAISFSSSSPAKLYHPDAHGTQLPLG